MMTWRERRAARTSPDILNINQEIRTTAIPFYSSMYCSGSLKVGFKSTFMYENTSMVANLQYDI
jgi:hypothetical protein